VVQVLIYLPRKIHKALKVEAAERGLSMGIIVEEALHSRIRMVRGAPDGAPSSEQEE
jgi:predicted HicB family RNase H-like nuclease